MEPVSRRRFIAGTVATASAMALRAGRALARTSVVEEHFEGPDAAGWGDGWRIDGAGNLATVDGSGVLEAGTRIHPVDRRAIAFAVDRRLRDAEMSADFHATGVGAGLVLRRTGVRTGYMAVFEPGADALRIYAKSRQGETRLAQAAHLGVAAGGFRLTFSAQGAFPTRLQASMTDALGVATSVQVDDETAELQQSGDPGVVATAEMISRGVEVAKQAAQLPADDGLASRAVAELSTAVIDDLRVVSGDPPGVTVPSVVCAVTGPPAEPGVFVSVGADVPCRVFVELSATPGFEDVRVVHLGQTGGFDSVIAHVDKLSASNPRFWRARLSRNGRQSYGPVRRLPWLPPPGSTDPVTLVVGACASELGPIFGHIAAAQPDVFVWEGDLMYPDQLGPLLQTESGYAGFWKALLSAPELQPILDGAAFCPQRDDHDYGGNNLDAGAIPRFGTEPWEAIVHHRPYYSFATGTVDVWVLDQRRWRDDPGLPDTPDKTLIGADQRQWLLHGLASSAAPFKIVCSPDPLFHPTNFDTNWGRGYTAERDVILEAAAATVSGRVVWITGDSHSAAVIERPGFLEVRAAPIDSTNHQASRGRDVVFSRTGRFFCLVCADEDAAGRRLHLALVDDSGEAVWETELRP